MMPGTPETFRAVLGQFAQKVYVTHPERQQGDGLEVDDAELSESTSVRRGDADGVL
jgi:hypothetical protein